MKRPPTADLPDPLDIEFSLFRHVEAFNLAPGSDPSALIPAQPQTSTDPGPPFSFWGRGALADWTLFVDSSSAGALDLTGLSEVRLSIGCIGLVVQGAVTPSTVQVTPAATGLPASARRGAARDGAPAPLRTATLHHSQEELSVLTSGSPDRSRRSSPVAELRSQASTELTSTQSAAEFLSSRASISASPVSSAERCTMPSVHAAPASAAGVSTSCWV